ncbi:MAG TPA: hypothetical protein DDY54_02825 [Deltaproteobacteria bacterium]|nr:hypothetical protein [Deltaproteobacteria bacterium]
MTSHKIKYFADTDTTLLELTDKAVSEIREVSENVYLDLDAAGNMVNLTIVGFKQRAPTQSMGTMRSCLHAIPFPKNRQPRTLGSREVEPQG